MPWTELADRRSVTRNQDGTIAATCTYRIGGGSTSSPPEGAGGLPVRGDSHPVYRSIIAQVLSFTPVPATGWECEVSYTNREIEIFQQTPTNIGQYRYGLSHSETIVQMPVARKTFKWLDQAGGDRVALDYYEVIGLDIPSGSMLFSVEVVEWAPSWTEIQAVRQQRGKIHQFGGAQGPLFRFMGGETQYLGSRGVGSDPVFRNVVRYHYRWVGDEGTIIDDPRYNELITPTTGLTNGPDGPTFGVLNREPFTQWVVIPSVNDASPPQFTLLRPYKLDDPASLRGWRSLPGAQYWIDLE
jgi:hypothetical protein